MQAAPPVSVRGSGGVVWRLGCALLPALAAMVFAAWMLAHSGIEGWRLGAASMAAGVVTICMARSTVAAVQRGRSQTRWWAAVATELRWDGQQWYCGASANSDPDVVIEPDVMIDLDGWLLLRLRAPGGGVSRWMPITAAEAGNAWHDLRAALYARAPQVAASVAATRR